MKTLSAGLMVSGLLLTTACLSPVEPPAATSGSSSAPAAAPEEPEAVPVPRQWGHFVRTARNAGLPKATWPSTAKNASLTAAIMCHNPASHGATEVRLYHDSSQWPMIRRGDILFARAFCPRAEPALTRALSGRPASPPTTSVPAANAAP